MLQPLLFAGQEGSLEAVWGVEILSSSLLLVGLLQGVQQVGGDPLCTSMVAHEGEEAGNKFWMSCTGCFPIVSMGAHSPSLVQVVCSYPLRPKVAELGASGCASLCLSTDTTQGQTASRQEVCRVNLTASLFPTTILPVNVLFFSCFIWKYRASFWCRHMLLYPHWFH